MKKFVLLATSVLVTLCASSQFVAIDSMKRVLRFYPADSNAVSIYIKMGNEWSRINTDSALSYARKSYRLALRLKYANGIAGGLALQAKIYLQKKDFARAYELYLEAMHKYTKLGNQNGTASVANGLGSTFQSQENHAKALEYFQQALTIYKRRNDKLGLAQTYLNIGIVNAETNHLSKAEGFYQKALQFAEPTGDKKLCIAVYKRLGTLYAGMQQYNKSLSASIRAKNLSLIAAQVPSVAEAYLNMGNAYRKLDKFDSAASSFNSALNYFTQLKNKQGIASTYSGIAALNFQQKEYDKALQLINLGNEVARQIRNNLTLYENYRLLVNISKARFDYKQAFDYYEEVLLLKDKLFNAEKASSIENIKASYDLEKKQKTIEELQQENELKTRQRNYLVLLFSLVVISLILLTYSVSQIKRKTLLLQEQKQLLEEQKNELEAQKNELEDLNVVKDKFFSVLSHDLRSPMGNILSLLNLITIPGVIGEDKKKQLFNRLKLSTSSALETMDNMLAWGKNQINENKMQVKEVNVFEISERVCRFLNQSAENKSIKIVNQVNPSVIINADKNRLEFVIRNLVSNALKFSHKNSKIELWTSADDTYVNIHVKDFGTGMKRELQETLFDVNKRESVNGTAGETGSGLGLALSKEFITQNNGDILVNSEPGNGTIFTIQHPWN